MMHDWGFGGGWGGGFLGPLGMLIPLVLLVVVIVLLVRWAGGRRGEGPQSPPRTSRDILDERFARGEIDKDEYDSRRKALEG